MGWRSRLGRLEDADTSLVFFIADFNWGRLAGFFESRKTPGVWKTGTLARFDGLDLAVDSLEKDAFAIPFLYERQPLSVRSQPGVTINKVPGLQSKKAGDRIDLRRRNLDDPRPPATRGAPLALIVGFRHWG